MRQYPRVNEKGVGAGAGSALSQQGWKADLSALTVPPEEKYVSRELRPGGIPQQRMTSWSQQMAISNSNASSENMERFQRTGHLHFVKLKMQIKDLKCLEAPCVRKSQKVSRGQGAGGEGREGERGSIHALAC